MEDRRSYGQLPERPQSAAPGGFVPRYKQRPMSASPHGPNAAVQNYATAYPIRRDAMVEHMTTGLVKTPYGFSGQRVPTPNQAVSRPQSALPRGAHCPTTPNPAVALADGLRRSIACQAAPTPWTRFYFPKMEDMAANKKGNPFYNHFDVIFADPVEEDGVEYTLAQTVPDWVNAKWDKLYYATMMGNEVERQAHGWCQVNMQSEDITKGREAMMGEGAAATRMTMAMFCDYVTRLAPRSRADWEPLLILLRGLVRYLVGQVELAEETARSEAAERERILREEAAAAAAAAREEINALEKEISELKEERGNLLERCQVFHERNVEQQTELEAARAEILRLKAVEDKAKEDAKAAAEVAKQLSVVTRELAAAKREAEAYRKMAEAGNKDGEEGKGGSIPFYDSRKGEAEKAAYDGWLKLVDHYDGDKELALSALDGLTSGALIGAIPAEEAASLMSTMSSTAAAEALEGARLEVARSVVQQWVTESKSQAAGAVAAMHAGPAGALLAGLSDTMSETLMNLHPDVRDKVFEARDKFKAGAAALRSAAVIEGDEHLEPLRDLDPKVAAEMFAEASPENASAALSKLGLKRSSQIVLDMGKWARQLQRITAEADPEANAKLDLAITALAAVGDHETLIERMKMVMGLMRDEFGITCTLSQWVEEDAEQVGTDLGSQEDNAAALIQARIRGAKVRKEVKLDGQAPIAEGAGEAAEGAEAGAGAAKEGEGAGAEESEEWEDEVTAVAEENLPIEIVLSTESDGGKSVASAASGRGGAGGAELRAAIIECSKSHLNVRKPHCVAVPIMLPGTSDGAGGRLYGMLTITLGAQDGAHAAVSCQNGTSRDVPISLSLITKIAMRLGAAAHSVHVSDEAEATRIEEAFEGGQGVEPTNLSEAKRDLAGYKALRRRLQRAMQKQSLRNMLATIKRYPSPPKGVLNIVCALLLVMAEDGMRSYLRRDLTIPPEVRSLWNYMRKCIELNALHPKYIIDRMQQVAETGKAQVDMVKSRRIKELFEASEGLVSAVTHKDAQQTSHATAVLRKWVLVMVGMRKAYLHVETFAKGAEAAPGDA